MYKTLIFDFDGTLADTLAVIVELYNHHAPRFRCLPITPHQQQTLQQHTVREIMEQHNVTVLKLGLLAVIIRIQLHNKIPQVALFDGLATIIPQLAGDYTLGIVSSNSKQNITTFLASHHLSEYFKFIYGSRSLFNKATVLTSAMKKYNCNPDTTLYIGDEVRDIEAAREIGIDCAAVTWGFQAIEALQKHNPDFLLTIPAELLTLEQ